MGVGIESSSLPNSRRRLDLSESNVLVDKTVNTKCSQSVYLPWWGSVVARLTGRECHVVPSWLDLRLSNKIEEHVRRYLCSLDHFGEQVYLFMFGPWNLAILHVVVSLWNSPGRAIRSYGEAKSWITCKNAQIGTLWLQARRARLPRGRYKREV